MRRLAKTVSLVLVLSTVLASAAWSGDVRLNPEDPEHRAAAKAALDNEWIEKLPYVSDVEASWLVCPNEKKEMTPVENNILVSTDTEEHAAILEKQLPGSLEGFPVVVGVDRSKQWEIEGEQMMAKVKPVIDDPSNKWILKIPHVIRMGPSVQTEYGEPKTGAVAIVVDSGKSIKEVQSKVPKTIGGFPTTFGQVENWSVGECFTGNGKGCDRDEDDNGADDGSN